MSFDAAKVKPLIQGVFSLQRENQEGRITVISIDKLPPDFLRDKGFKKVNRYSCDDHAILVDMKSQLEDGQALVVVHSEQLDQFGWFELYKLYWGNF